MIKKYLNKKTIITFLCVVEFFLIISALVSFSHKDVEMFSVGMNGIDNDLVALMIEDDNGDYQNSSSNEFPPASEYRFSSTRSACMDSNKKVIEDSISYDKITKRVKVEVRQTAYCYLYFEQINYLQNYLIKHNDKFNMWQSGLEGDGYRFAGSGNASASTTPKNFICFGTSNKDECVANPSTYMYRIIGVFKDSEGVNHAKLIKYATLSSAIAWNTANTNVNWNSSTLYSALNGSTYLTNTTYIPNSNWSDKIFNWNWTMANAKTYSGGPDYYSTGTTQMYLHEMNKAGKTNAIGEWIALNSKISLMYASDYQMSLGSSALNYVGNSNKVTLKTGWMHVDNNLNISNNHTEWTMSRYGPWSSGYIAWFIEETGSVNGMHVINPTAIRPTFYLTSYNEYLSGTGTLNDPIIIEAKNINMPSVQASINDNKIIANFIKGNNELDSYCISTSSSDINCKWIKLSSSTITEIVTEDGTYYIHVKDKEGFTGHSNGLYYTDKTLSKQIIKYAGLWQSGLEGDGYRYVGTNPNNYICFGTTNKYSCTGTPNNYMYRIIGVFPDESGAQHVKLVKTTGLAARKWWNQSGSDSSWENSTLYSAINGSDFLSNTTYVPNTTWNNKIANCKWANVTTLTNMSSGPNYYDVATREMYLHELNRSSKSSSIGTWVYPSAKIGLIYASDYALSLGSSSLNYNSGTNYKTLKTGWMHLSNNGDTLSDEWTVSRYGNRLTYGYCTWIVDYRGYILPKVAAEAAAVRPAFYLEDNVQLLSGSGTQSDPYIIKE